MFGVANFPSNALLGKLSLTVLAVVTIQITGMRDASASCIEKQYDLQMADRAKREAFVYYSSGKIELSRMYDDLAEHYTEMAERDDCDDQESRDSARAAAAFEKAERLATQARLHAENVARAYARAHPSKWTLAQRKKAQQQQQQQQHSKCLMEEEANIERADSSSCIRPAPSYSQRRDPFEDRAPERDDVCR
jgi:hypothetical protein